MDTLFLPADGEPVAPSLQRKIDKLLARVPEEHRGAFVAAFDITGPTNALTATITVAAARRVVDGWEAGTWVRYDVPLKQRDGSTLSAGVFVQRVW